MVSADVRPIFRRSCTPLASSARTFGRSATKEGGMTSQKTQFRASRRRFLQLLALSAVPGAACGSGDDAAIAAGSVLVLDPKSEFFQYFGEGGKP